MENTSSRIREWLRFFPKGFTLVELIVVITILAILATIGFLALSGYSQDAKDSSIKANVRSVQTAIVSEAAVTGNSARYYVTHDADYALSGAFAYVDGTGNALTGGDLGASPLDSNYTAGKPNYAKLKLNPEKFKISASGLPGRLEGLLVSFDAGTDRTHAAYDASSVMAAGADFQVSGMDGRKRLVSYVQAAGISPVTKLASVSGNFPSTGVPSGYVSGLLRADPGNAMNLTGALLEGLNVSVVVEASPVTCNVNRGQTKWDSLAANQWVCFEDQWGNRIAVWKLVNIGVGGNMWDTAKIYTRDTGTSTWILRNYYGAANVASYSHNGVSNSWIYGSGHHFGGGGSYAANNGYCSGAMLIYCNSCTSGATGWTSDAPNTPYGNSVGHGVAMCYVPTKMFGFMKTVYTQQ